jgi:hypothetical protein
VIFAVDVDAAGQTLRAGRLGCPRCGGVLRVWARARTHRVYAADGGRIELMPDRGLCRGCGVSHVIVPAWYVPRRAYTVDVIGQVLLGGAERTPYAVLAERAGVPAGTIASWLRAAKRAATSLIGHATRVAGHAVREHRPPTEWLGSDLAEALDALGSAATAFARAAVPTPAAPAAVGAENSAEPVTGTPSPMSIDPRDRLEHVQEPCLGT